MLDARERLGFALEARQPLGVGRDRPGQDLHGDVAVEAFVAGAVDLAHAASTDQIEQPVMPQDAAAHVRPPEQKTGGQGRRIIARPRYTRMSMRFAVSSPGPDRRSLSHGCRAALRRGAAAAAPQAASRLPQAGQLVTKELLLTPGTYARVTTSEGEFTVRLFEQQAPKTVANFVGLAEGTKDPATGKPGQSRPFYDGLVFHRIIAGFMLQGGDPQGDGRGGPGYTFTDEFDPPLRFDRAGLLAMANRGPNTNGSQFFITLAAHRVAEQQAHDLRRGRRGDGRHHEDRQRPDGPWRSPGHACGDEDRDDSADQGVARLRSPAASFGEATWPGTVLARLVSNTVRTGERSPPRPGPRGVSPGAHSTEEVSRGPRTVPPDPRAPSVRIRRPSVRAPAVHRRSRARRW